MKSLLITLVLASFLWSAEGFKNCDTTKESAQSGLAKQIFSTVESSYSSEKSVTQGLFDFSFGESKSTLKTKSKLSLSKLEFTTEGEQICAFISKDTLIETAQGKIKEIKLYDLDKLPKDEIQIINYLDERLDEIAQAKAISAIFPDAFKDSSRKMLEEKYKLFLDERGHHHAQKISFNITPKEAELFIDGNKVSNHHDIYLKAQKHTFLIKTEGYADYTGSFELTDKQNQTKELDLAGHRLPQVTLLLSAEAALKIDDKEAMPNAVLTLKPGSHTYYISSEKFCPIQGEFEVGLGETRNISIDHSAYNFPQLTVTSNQSSAKLTINSEPFALGKNRSFQVCEAKEIAFSVKFEDQVQTRTITLEPGLMHTVSIDFLTNADKKLLREVADIYKTKSRIILRAGAESYDDTVIKDGLMTSYGASFIWHRKWLRHGFGVDYAQGDAMTGKSATAIHGHYSVAVGLNSFGSESLPLHIGHYAILPYIGAQVGFTHQDFGVDENGLLAKADIGFDFAINTSLSLQLFVQKNFYLEEESRIGIAVSFIDPF